MPFLLAALAWPEGDGWHVDNSHQTLWRDVTAGAESVEVIGPVSGWAYWTHAARVKRRGCWHYYLTYGSPPRAA